MTQHVTSARAIGPLSSGGNQTVAETQTLVLLSDTGAQQPAPLPTGPTSQSIGTARTMVPLSSGGNQTVISGQILSLLTDVDAPEPAPLLDAPTQTISSAQVAIPLSSSGQQTATSAQAVRLFTDAGVSDPVPLPTGPSSQSIGTARAVVPLWDGTVERAEPPFVIEPEPSENNPFAGDTFTPVSLPDAPYGLRSFGMSLDGHDFYVLHLTSGETVVYDTTSGTWSQWQTNGQGGWQVHEHAHWHRDNIVVPANGQGLQALSTDSGMDANQTPVHTRVHAWVDLDGRQTVNIKRLDVVSSLTGETGVMNIQFSEDYGTTFSPSIGTAIGTKPVRFHSLGTQKEPGFVLRVEDTNGPLRINAVYIEATGEGES